MTKKLPPKSKRKGYKPPSDVDADRREYLDQFDRRIGHMWPEDFEAQLKATLGRNWRTRFAQYCGVSKETVTSYLKGVHPIPKYIAQLVLHMRWEYQNRPHDLKKRKESLKTPWLDDT